MITLGDVKDCDECKEPTKKRVGTSFDCGGPGHIAPVWDCENDRCKKRNNTNASYLIRYLTNYDQKGGAGND